jgi:hypothetical protein
MRENEMRLECVKLARESGVPQSDMVSFAEKLWQFVTNSDRALNDTPNSGPCYSITDLPHS